MSATSARREVIKLANKINLSGTVHLEKNRYATRMEKSCGASKQGSLVGICLTFVFAASVVVSLGVNPLSAQVPPRSEAAQEQREEKAPH
ncbi:hypothetical protein LCGC14_0466920 [marine sediment metagenome]|uniref:Uncharacterized protein n=1 Tax=marine sediment metagenome TaxID=412755 RepID=A0A0F9SWC6_9ZZZZ